MRWSAWNCEEKVRVTGDEHGEIVEIERKVDREDVKREWYWRGEAMVPSTVRLAKEEKTAEVDRDSTSER